MIDVLGITGYYTMLAMVMNTTRTPLAAALLLPAWPRELLAQGAGFFAGVFCASPPYSALAIDQSVSVALITAGCLAGAAGFVMSNKCGPPTTMRLSWIFTLAGVVVSAVQIALWIGRL